MQGDQHAINRFNAEVLIPELRAAGRSLEVITYPGEGHCFSFNGRHEADSAASKAFHDVHAFLQRHLPTKPKPIGAALVKKTTLPLE